MELIVQNARIFSQELSNADNSFLYHLMIPLVLSFGFGRIALHKAINTFSSQTKTLHQQHEMWNSIYYVSCLILSLTIGEIFTRDESWRFNFVNCYKGWPHDQVHTWGVKFYYTFCLSFYLYSFVWLFFEEKKKDFVAMLLHHLVTIVTVALSGYIQHYRVGIVIMLLFDACDVALEFAKLFAKCKEDFLSFCSFVIFLVLWIRNRLYYFPIYIIPSIVNAEVLSNHEIPYHKLHVLIVIVLFALNVYWSYFIYRKLKGYIRNGIKKDNVDPRDGK